MKLKVYRVRNDFSDHDRYFAATDVADLLKVFAAWWKANYNQSSPPPSPILVEFYCELENKYHGEPQQ